MAMMCDIDELLVAMAMVRSARDHLMRQLPDNFVQDTPEQMVLLQRLNAATVHLAQATLAMRQAIDDYLMPMVTIDVATAGAAR